MFTSLLRSSIRRKVLAVLSTVVLAAMSATPAQATLSVTPAGAAFGVNLSTFATGFPTAQSGNNTGTVGPVGIAFPSSGGVLVSDYPGNARLFPTDSDGQNAASFPVGTYGQGNALGLAAIGNNVYMAQQPNAALVQINANGTFNQTIVTGIGLATAVAANPTNGHLFVSGRTTSQIFDVDPVAKTKSVFANVQADGLVFSADGSILYAADPTNTGHVFGYNTTTKAQVFDSGVISGDPGGIALGTGTLTGKLIVDTYLSGNVIAVDLATLSQTIIASGGSRAEHIGMDPNGSLLLTQSDSIVRLTAVPEPAGLTVSLLMSGLALLRRRRRHCAPASRVDAATNRRA
jgi:hypothetical protein